MTPNELAAELGISPKTLRAWLRKMKMRPPTEKWQHWHLAPWQIAEAHLHWSGR